MSISRLDERGYLEVETPVLQPLVRRCFRAAVHHAPQYAGYAVYLRIADELYLKRLIVGGYDGVYEIAKDFRNEGMDRTHNPEFTMMEVYVAYQDYLWMMGLVEQMIYSVALALNGSAKVKLGEHEIDFTPPWKRLTMFGAIEEYTGLKLQGKDEGQLRSLAKEHHVDVEPAAGAGKIVDEIFSVKVQPHLYSRPLLWIIR